MSLGVGTGGINDVFEMLPASCNYPVMREDYKPGSSRASLPPSLITLFNLSLQNTHLYGSLKEAVHIHKQHGRRDKDESRAGDTP